MKIEKDIKVTDKEKHCINLHFFGEVIEDVVFLRVYGQGFEEINIQGSDFFECLLEVRKVLEKQGLFILCKGAMINVSSSRMSKQMGRGIKAYVLEIGKQASFKNLINIFDPAKETEVGSINEQRSFYQRWLESLEINNQQ